MEKSVKITGIISGTFVLVALIVTSVIMQFAPSDSISVNGEAQLGVVPDLFIVNFNIQKKATTASEAEAGMNFIYDTLKNSLIDLGINEDEVQTTSININPNYNWINGMRKQDGYIAYQYVRLELPIEDTEKIGEIIDAGVEAEALISNVNFELSDSLQKEKKAEAIKLASEDAKIKAESMVEGLNKKLGKIISVSDSGINYYPWRVFETSVDSDFLEAGSLAKEATANISPEEQTIYGNVRVVYRIR